MTTAADDGGPPLAGMVVGSVRALWRYPVKSTAGEAVPAAAFDRRGLRHDRGWAVYTPDGGIGSGKTTRRFRRLDGLLAWRSTLAAGEERQPVPTLVDPDGQRFRVDDPRAEAALARAFGQPLRLRPEASVSHHDESGVHLVTTASLRAAERLVGAPVDVRRLRANVLLEVDDALPGALRPEDGWLGAELAVGADVVLRIGPGMPRCVMVDRPQAGVPAGPALLTALGRAHGTRLGVQAIVLRGGTVSVGDVARLTARRPMT